MSTLHYVFFFLLAICILIVIHELGHFWAARLCGVKVLRFSLGFGKPLLCGRFGKDKTEWVLAGIPLGGYVKMLDSREGEVDPAEASREFTGQPIYKRFIIVAAGPVANLILAALLYWGLALGGSRDLPAVLGEVPAASAAAHAGLRAGDRIVGFDGLPIQGWTELRWQLVQQALGSGEVSVTVERGGVQISDLKLSINNVVVDEKGPDPARQLGFQMPDMVFPPILGELSPGMPAERAGFKSGDLIRTIDGRPVASWKAFVGEISQAPGRELTVQLERAGQLLTLRVTPELTQAGMPSSGNQFQKWVRKVTGVSPQASPAALPKLGRVGALPHFDDKALEARLVPIHYGLVDGAAHAVRQTVEMAAFDLHAFWNIIRGSLSWRNVSGPISIADVAGQSAEMGVAAYLTMLAALSVSLGVLNLLPVPILDGGHLLYYVFECVRGKAVSERVELFGQRVGLTILVLLMSLAFFNDLNRVLFG
jgi:regulator of sigma E protease